MFVNFSTICIDGAPWSYMLCYYWNYCINISFCNKLNETLVIDIINYTKYPSWLNIWDSSSIILVLTTNKTFVTMYNHLIKYYWVSCKKCTCNISTVVIPLYNTLFGDIPN